MPVQGARLPAAGPRGTFNGQLPVFLLFLSGRRSSGGGEAGLRPFDRLSAPAYDNNEVLMSKPVFYDPRRSRWKRVRVLSNCLGVFVTLLIIFFVYSAISGVHLPELLLQTQKRPYHALKEKEREKEKKRHQLTAQRGHRKSKLSPSQVKLNAE